MFICNTRVEKAVNLNKQFTQLVKIWNYIETKNTTIWIKVIIPQQAMPIGELIKIWLKKNFTRLILIQFGVTLLLCMQQLSQQPAMGLGKKMYGPNLAKKCVPKIKIT